MTDRAATQRAIEAVWRIESPRLIAALARMMRDVGVAEDLAQDALVWCGGSPVESCAASWMSSANSDSS